MKMDVTSWSVDYWLENEEQCKKLLENETAWKMIPSANYLEVHELTDNRLVRFQGMIQDMYNPEYFYEKVEVFNEKEKTKYVKTSKYRDVTEFLEHEVAVEESGENVTSCRQTFVVVSVPGVNEWVEKSENNRARKRIEKPLKVEVKSTKRALEDDEMETDDHNKATEMSKKQCTSVETGSSTTNFVSKEHILNFPLSDENGKCCHVKVYSDSDGFKLNEMIDVIGFLSLDPVLTERCYHNQEEDNQMEIQTHNPPPSLVPRIHCVAFKKIKNHNLLNHIELGTNEVESLRKDLMIVLTQMLLGDELAAEYLLCHLISMIYLRNELLILGKFSLNISNIPAEKYPNYGEDLYKIIESLVPKSHYIPMTLENMNTLSFVPKKDYECNRLTSGVLQLSCNTQLVLDETKLQPGKLDESGCRAIAALSSMIKNQKVTYDFNYYQMDFDCDIPVLVLSEGKSLLSSDLHIPLKPQTECLETFPEIQEAAKHFLKPELLDKIRVYLSKVRHSDQRNNISDQITELVQNEFVQMRQNGTATADDLHQLLVIARMLCISFGKSTLEESCWFKACQMEQERKLRFKK